MAENTFSDHISSRAGSFLSNYSSSDDFKQRYSIWTRFLDKYTLGANFAYDIGCGPGLFSFYLAEKGIRVEAWDGSQGMIELCEQEKSRKSEINTKFRKLYIPVSVTPDMELADLVISSSVIEYVPDSDGVAKMFNHLLKPGGVLLVSFPNKSSWYRTFEKIAFRISGKPSYYKFVQHLWTVDDAKKIFETIGFQFIEHEFYANRSSFSKVAGWLGGKKASSNLVIMAFEKNQGLR